MATFTLPKNSTVGEGRTYSAPAGAKNVKSFRIYRWDPDEFGSGRWEEALRPVHYLCYLLREIYVTALAKATGLDENTVLRQVANRRTKEALCLI